jgi:methionine-rich copper-binding protein CopC
MSWRTVFFMAALLAAPQAQAHAFLVKSMPGVGSVTGRPGTLILEFSEAIELSFSEVSVSSASGKAIMIEQFRFADDAHKVLVANLPALVPGPYHVSWHVVSADTHWTEGDFIFTVKP